MTGMNAITFSALTGQCVDDVERVTLNRALRDDLMTREYAASATTVINGGDRVVITDDGGSPMTVAGVLMEIEAFLLEAYERRADRLNELHKGELE